MSDELYLISSSNFQISFSLRTVLTSKRKLNLNYEYKIMKVESTNNQLIPQKSSFFFMVQRWDYTLKVYCGNLLQSTLNLIQLILYWERMIEYFQNISILMREEPSSLHRVQSCDFGTDQSFFFLESALNLNRFIWFYTSSL